MTPIPLRYIIIDDDQINNFESTRAIKSVVGIASVRYFTDPDRGLKFIEWDFARTRLNIPTVLLLDINMPGMSGWDVLEKFKNFSQKIKDQITVYILSSSIDSADHELAQSNPLVADYILKPLTRQKMQLIVYKTELLKTG